MKLSYAQEKPKSQLALMQGIWENIMNSESEKAFTIIKGKSSMNFVYSIHGGLDFPLSESVEGFYSGDTESDSLNVDSLDEDGLHYIIIDKNDIANDGWVSKSEYLSPDYFACDGELMSINGGQLVEYGKREDLPFEALNKLYKRGKLDRRDYIKEYLNLKVLAIRSSKCIVYSKPDKQTDVRLTKDDIVIITEEAGKWFKVIYSESGIGWIKREDVKQ
jgi:hypothetical protein